MFTKGQKLVYVGATKPVDPTAPCLKKGEICTYMEGSYYSDYICLVEYGPFLAFYERSFRPIQGLLAKSELLEKFIEVKEASDLPIKQPDHVEV